MLRFAMFALALYPAVASADGFLLPSDAVATLEPAAARPEPAPAVKLAASLPAAPAEGGKSFRFAFIHRTAARANTPPAKPQDAPPSLFVWGVAGGGVAGD